MGEFINDIYSSIYEWNIKYLLRSICLTLNLKVLILEERTSSVGSAFQIVTTRLEKKICVCYSLPEVYS